MTLTILITSGEGFIGYYLCYRLLNSRINNNFIIIIFYNSNELYSSNYKTYKLLEY